MIDHGDGTFSQSAHLATIVVNPGDNVVAGQIIGTIGRTGTVPPRMDTHLHFEVRIGSSNSPYDGGHVRDPLSYFERVPADGEEMPVTVKPAHRRVYKEMPAA